MPFLVLYSVMMFKSSYVVKQLVAVLSLVLLQITASAQTYTSSLSLEYGNDAADNHGFWLNGDHRVSPDTQLLFGIGGTTSENEVNGPDTGFLLLGVGFNHQNNNTTELTYERWGSTDDFIINSFGASFIINKPNYQFVVSPGYRFIELKPQVGRPVNIGSLAFGLEYTRYLGEMWRATLGGFVYDYSKDMTRLNNVRSFVYFGGPTMALATGLLDDSKYFELGMDMQHWAWTLGVEQNTAAISKLESESAYGHLYFNLTDEITASLKAGKVLNTTQTDNWYASVGVGYYF